MPSPALMARKEKLQSPDSNSWSQLEQKYVEAHLNLTQKWPSLELCPWPLGSKSQQLENLMAAEAPTLRSTRTSQLHEPFVLKNKL